MSELTTIRVPVLASSVDWITATTRPGFSDQFILSSMEGWFQLREREGYQRKSWTFKGYNGQTIEGLSWGTREDSAVVRLSGSMAARHGYTVLRLARNVSRLDLQVTIEDPVIGRRWDNIVREQALKDARVKAGTTAVTHIDRWPDGRSTYIGSRSSDRYFRVYDKWAESKGNYPVGSWRFEVEYKGARAMKVATFLTKSEGQPEVVRFIVGKAFADYGVTMPTELLPRHWNDKSPKEESTDARRLAWLETSVAPMIERMLESASAETILNALGLGHQLGNGRIPPSGYNGSTGEIAVEHWSPDPPIGWGTIDPFGSDD